MLNTPIAYALQEIKAPKLQWSSFQGMSTVLAYDSAQIESGYQAIAGICDVSCLQRVAVKGPNAAAWLEQGGMLTPVDANSWRAFDATDQRSMDQDSLILKLGSSEFLIEDQFNGAACASLALAATVQSVTKPMSQPIVAGVYKVQRNDAAFILSGSQMLNLLSELCMLDLSPAAFSQHDVLMTQVAGISATMIRQAIKGETIYRLWCDGTYGAYMWETLITLAGELGGGAVGLAHYLEPASLARLEHSKGMP